MYKKINKYIHITIWIDKCRSMTYRLIHLIFHRANLMANTSISLMKKISMQNLI